MDVVTVLKVLLMLVPSDAMIPMQRPGSGQA